MRMNIAEWSIRKSVITWVLTLIMVVGGILAFNNLSRLEDPEFTIKQAVVFTPYPGASAAEVEKEVTNRVERAVQEMGQLWYVESRSSRGLSVVYVNIKMEYMSEDLPQVWDELRRKVNDLQPQLPPGAGPSLVNDDFGDVYGVYLAFTGEGYTDAELYETAKFLQRELLKAQGVKRISLYGAQKEAIYVEMRREKMAELGISPTDIYQALANKNLAAPAGYITLGAEYLPVNPTGEFKSATDFGDLLIASRRDTGRLIYLRDVADIRRGYQEPPAAILRLDGKPAIGLAVSTVKGGNVVEMGASLKAQFQRLQPQLPVGMDVHVIALQPDAVTLAINGFLVSLLQAVVIVVVVLLFFMGLRSGLIIGGVLFVTILGTFIFMAMGDITLERISLGALVIALGMLVDNAIVVTDGMRMRMQQGIDATAAAREVVGQTAIPLLGATFVAIAAFAAIGTSQDSTGEYTRSLFTVIMISLLLSWVTAVTVTPLFCKHFLKPRQVASQGEAYDGRFYQVYRRFLAGCIRHRWVTTGVVVLMFASALAGFGQVKQSFFPDATRPQLYIDYWFPDSYHIEAVAGRLQHAEEMLLATDHVTGVATEVGGGQPRFLLTYTPEQPRDNFGRIIVSVDDYKVIADLAPTIQQAMDAEFTDALVNVREFALGPSTGGKIQLRIYGDDAAVLRQLAARAESILQDDPLSKAVRNEWGDMVKVLRPDMAEAQARSAGVDRPHLARTIEMSIEGSQVGVFRERDELLPIIARAPDSERTDFDNLAALPVWSPAAQANIPLGQLVSGFDIEFENANLWRRDRARMIRIHADPREALPSELLNRVKPEIERALDVDLARYFSISEEAAAAMWADYSAQTIPVRDTDAIPLKGMPGYFMAWGGEAEDSARATAQIAGKLPIFFGLMVLIVIFLFNSIRKTVVIWLTVPLAIIGVTVGLLMFNQPFGFMALLGLMSLAGMLIKNAIVLIDQIDAELAAGKPPFESIVDAGVSRIMPVSMAAATTILGMVPLLADAFFVSMAVTIMFGLGFATVLTLIVVPVFYALIFRVPAPRAVRGG